MITNNRLIYDYLFLHDLGIDKLHENIQKMSVSEILDLTDKLNELIYIDKTKSSSNFDLIANTSLSGLTGQCDSINCRTNNLNHLIRKSSLYANKVWIKYPLAEYYRYKDVNVNLDYLKEKIIDDLTIIHQYRTLIESGIFAFAHTEQHFCYNCFGALTDQVDWPMVKIIKSLKKDLKTEFSKGAKYRIVDEYSEIFLEITAKNKSLFEHEILYYSIKNPELEFPNVLKRKSQKLTPKEAFNSEQVDSLANNVIKNIVMQNWYAENYGANYLTNTPIEIHAISLLNETKTNNNSDLLYDNLVHTLPVIENVRIEKIIELRKKEPEAFINYRNSIDNLLNNSAGLNKKELEEAFKDEIQPTIDQMNQTIDSNKRKIIKDSIHSLITGSSLVSIGVFSGLLPTGIGQALAGLAITHQGSKLMDNAKKLIYSDYEQKEEKYYFLWKSLQ